MRLERSVNLNRFGSMLTMDAHLRSVVGPAEEHQSCENEARAQRTLAECLAVVEPKSHCRQVVRHL